MSEPAFDIKPERPFRTELDPIRTMEALQAGLKICWKAGYDPDKTNLQHIIWALIVEATRTERAMEAPRGKGYGNGWPEIAYTKADHTFAANARREANMPEYEITYRPDLPTAAQISRHGEVTLWLRFCHADDKLRARDVLWGRARDGHYRNLQAATGLTPNRLRSIKSEQLRIIAARLRRELRGFNLDAAFRSAL